MGAVVEVPPPQPLLLPKMKIYFQKRMLAKFSKVF
jgi:hypothetical protein